MKNRILILGASGTLGSFLVDQLSSRDYDVRGVSKDELDFKNIEKSIENFKNLSNCTVINCAGYMPADKCETHPDESWKINFESPFQLAKTLCQNNRGNRWVQISSDFVFDGKSSKPFSSAESKMPKSIYGLHKSELENHLLDECFGASVIRISGLTVFSGKGKTFLEKIISKAYSQDQISVVSNLKHSIVLDSLIASNLETFENPKSTISHVVNSGTASWFEMAEIALKVLEIPCEVIPISSESLNLPAKRPEYSVLEPDPQLKQQLDWRYALERHLLREKDKYQSFR